MDPRATGLLRVSTGADWAPAETVSVMLDDARWHVAKSVRVSDGLGGWTLVWAPTVGSVVLTLSPSPVAVGQAYEVNAEFTSGLPAGATLLFRQGVTVYPAYPEEGATYVTLPGMYQNIPGLHDWYLDVTVGGDTTTYGPTVQFVEPLLTEISDIVVMPTTVVQGQPWTLSVAMRETPPVGTKVRYVAVNPADPIDQLDSGWLDWGSSWVQTDFYPVSRNVTVTVQTPAGQIARATETFIVGRENYSVTVPDGGDLQAALNAANLWFMANRTFPVNFDDPSSMATVLLEPGGTYTVGTALRYRGGVRLVALGATIRATIGTSTHLFINSEHGGGGYKSPHTDWMILGGTLDAQNYSGGISTTHTNRFRLDGVTISNIGGRKHHLEINSSGGAPQSGVYNVEVLNCIFQQASKSLSPPSLSPPRTSDEAIQLDFSWNGAAPTTANDGTVTNNVRISGCLFTNGPRAIGGHTYSLTARGVHSNILIENNVFNDINPNVWGDGPSSEVSEGAVRAYMWAHVDILNNRFNRCLQPVMLFIPQGAKGSVFNSTDLTVQGNVFTDCGGGLRHCIYGNADNDSLKRFERVFIANNTLTGAWLGEGYFAGCDETDGTIFGYSTGVVIVNNSFQPTNYSVSEQKAYNKYRSANSTNLTGVTITGNTVSDGAISNV